MTASLSCWATAGQAWTWTDAALRKPANCTRRLKRSLTAWRPIPRYSPSENGVKIFLRGSLPSGRRKIEQVFGVGDHAGIEMYDSGRYFCVTGNRL